MGGVSPVGECFWRLSDDCFMSRFVFVFICWDSLRRLY